MRIHVISDLHLAGRYTPPADVDADITCIVGDLGPWVGPVAERTVTFLRAIPRPVYMVLGNHDFYHTGSRDVRERGQLDPCFGEVIARCPNVTLLHNEGVVVNDGDEASGDMWVYLYGTPLWSGLTLPIPELADDLLDKLGRPATPEALAHALVQFGISDFRHQRQMLGYRSWTTQDHVAAHRDAADRLAMWLAAHPTGRRVVMTHWLPSERCVAPQWRGHPLNCYFTAELDHLIEAHQPDLWLFGHTHSHVDTRIARTRMVANPLGYAGEDSGFDPGLVVEA